MFLCKLPPHQLFSAGEFKSVSLTQTHAEARERVVLLHFHLNRRSLWNTGTQIGISVWHTHTHAHTGTHTNAHANAHTHYCACQPTWWTVIIQEAQRWRLSRAERCCDLMLLPEMLHCIHVEISWLAGCCFCPQELHTSKADIALYWRKHGIADSQCALTYVGFQNVQCNFKQLIKMLLLFFLFLKAVFLTYLWYQALQTVLVLFPQVLRYLSLGVLLPPQYSGGECNFAGSHYKNSAEVSLLLAAKRFHWDHFLLKK